jgi:hypothetical protein
LCALWARPQPFAASNRAICVRWRCDALWRGARKDAPLVGGESHHDTTWQATGQQGWPVAQGVEGRQWLKVRADRGVLPAGGQLANWPTIPCLTGPLDCQGSLCCPELEDPEGTASRDFPGQCNRSVLCRGGAGGGGLAGGALLMFRISSEIVARKRPLS